MTTRDLQGFNNAILDTFNIMRISTRQKLVGSASVVGNIITNDYDLNETVIGSKDTLKKLHQIMILIVKKKYNDLGKHYEIKHILIGNGLYGMIQKILKHTKIY